MAEKDTPIKPDDDTAITADPIEVVIDETPAPAVAVETAPSTPATDDVDDAVTALKAQLENEKAARLAETNRAAQEAQRREKAEGDLKTFRSTAHESQYTLVIGQIEALNDKATASERDLAEANAAGDFAKAAAIQRQMARLESQIMRLEEGKADLEARKTDGTPDAAQPVAPASTLDPVDTFISNLQVSERDRSWLRSHRDVVTDQAKFNKVSAAASYAANVEGLAPDSDAFYAFIEAGLGITHSAAPAPIPPATPPAAQPRKQPTFSAPPSRDSMPINGTQKKTGRIRLSAAQQDAAKDSGMTVVEYAKHLVKLVENGELDERNLMYVN